MNEMQAHGLLIPVGSKPFEVWIDKNNSLAELQDLVNGNVEVLRVLGNGVDLWVNDEGLFNGSQPNRAIYATKHMEEVGYLDQLTFGHPAAATISVIRVQSTTSIRSATNQSCMNRFKETRR